MIDDRAIDEVAPLIDADDFYRQAHRSIYRSMVNLASRKEAIDVVTVEEQLRAEGQLDAAGGAAYLAQLGGQVPTSANLLYYAGIIRKNAVLRRVIANAGELIEECYGDVESIDDFVNKAEARFFAISENRSLNPYQPIKEVVTETFAEIGKRYESTEVFTGVRSGFIELDKITSGWQSSDLIIVAARPAMGKTAFCLNMAANAALRFGKTVLFCSLEMSNQQLVSRMLGSEARVNVSDVWQGKLSEKGWQSIIAAAAALNKAQIFLDDTPGLAPQTLSARARRLQKEHGLDLVIIDYLQLMETLSPNINSREQQISDVSRRLKMLAKELSIPVIALAQLNRGVESRTDKRPMLSDLRESGAIEQDADLILFLYRDEYYNKEESPKPGIADVIIGKHRSGAIGDVELRFFPEYTKFENLARGGFEAAS